MAQGVPSVSGMKANDVIVSISAPERDDDGYPEKGPRRGGAKATRTAARTRATKRATTVDDKPPASASTEGPVTLPDLVVDDPDGYMADFTKRQAARGSAISGK
jgi:putative transposase